MPLSRKNPRVQAVRSLLRSAGNRTAAQRFVLDGPKLIDDALRAGIRLEEAFASLQFLTDAATVSLRAALERHDVPIHAVEPTALRALSSVRTPQGVVAVGRVRSDVTVETLAAADAGDLLIAAGIQDPGNAGALVRIAAAAGFGGVVGDLDTADFWSAKALRGSAGTVLRTPALRVPDLAGFVRSLAARGCRVVATAARGGSAPRSLAGATRVAFVLGSEGRGIPEAVRAACTDAVTIPMAPHVESLNVAAAAAVLAFSRRA